MANNKRPRKEYKPRPVRIWSVPQDVIDQTKGILNRVGLLTYLKLPKGTLSTKDLCDIEYFVNWSGFTLLVRHDIDSEHYDEACDIQQKFALALTSMVKRTRELNKSSYICTGEELQTIQEGVDYFLDPMKEFLQAEPRAFFKVHKAFQEYNNSERAKLNSPIQIIRA